MKLFDYTNLLNTINEVDLEKTKLRNIQQAQIQNKLAELEAKLLNSGILEDWHELIKVMKKINYNQAYTYNRFKSDKLDRIYCKTEKFFEYDGCGDFTKSYYYGREYYGISPTRSLTENKIVWVTTDKSIHAGEKTKILIIETFFETYEEYREYCLAKVSEHLGTKLEENEKLKNEIMMEL